MGQRRSVPSVAVIGLGLAILLTAPAPAYSPPLLDLWTPAVLQRIRDRATLNPHIIPRLGYVEVFFDSEIGEAKWADSEPPYEIHTGDTIRIHGYLATPAIGGPYPGSWRARRPLGTRSGIRSRKAIIDLFQLS